MIKKALLKLAVLISIVIISILGIFYFISNFFYNSPYEKIYSDNSRIIKNYDSYSYLKRAGLSIKNETNLEFKFSGINSLWKLSTKEDGKLTIDYSSKLDSGNFKVLLVTPNDEIINILEQSEEGSKTLEIPKGVSKIKIVGLEASGSLKLILESKNISIQPLSQ